MVKKPAVSETQETWVPSLGWKDSLEEEMTTHSSILAWEILWREEPGGLQSMGSKRVGHDWVTERVCTQLPRWMEESWGLQWFRLYTWPQCKACARFRCILLTPLVILDAPPQTLPHQARLYCQWVGEAWNFTTLDAVSTHNYHKHRTRLSHCINLHEYRDPISLHFSAGLKVTQVIFIFLLLFSA